MANNTQQEHEHTHHHHHHHRDDYASRFKRKSLQSIEFRRKADKWLKIALLVLSAVMMLIVVIAYLFG
jgi:lipopolysaccharide/colanic/teichoic acid biosynthesis glycosyltransferase